MTLADRHDRYDDLMRLADVFDATGAEMRGRAGLGEQVLRDEAVAASADLAPVTFGRFDDDVRAATTGRHGLLARSVELDADALVVRATVATYRWIDDLQRAAERTLGSIAGRAIGYLAPDVALGGAIVTAGLIETDALDRDGVVDYLDELAGLHPELRDHAATSGGLIDGLQLRSWLTTGNLDPAAARGGLRAIGAAELDADLGSAVRDVAARAVADDGHQTDEAPAGPADDSLVGDRPAGLADLLATLTSTTDPVAVREVAPQRWVAYLPGPQGGGSRLRLVVGDHGGYAERAAATIAEAVPDDARVLLVGCGVGGTTAVDLAAHADAAFAVDHVVTAGAPSALVPRMPPGVRVLSLEDRDDPVALLGSLVNADSSNRLTVVFDGGDEVGTRAYVTGARAADAAAPHHPDLAAELDRMRELGYLS